MPFCIIAGIFLNHFLDFFEEGDSITELVITKATTVGSVNGYGFNKLPNLKKLTLPGSLEHCSMNPYYINDLIEEVLERNPRTKIIIMEPFFGKHREKAPGKYIKENIIFS